MPDLIATGAFTEATAAHLRAYIEEGKTMLISGGTGSGKTTLLNALADYIPEHERIVVIEDTKELRIGKPNLLGLGMSDGIARCDSQLQRSSERPHYAGAQTESFWAKSGAMKPVRCLIPSTPDTPAAWQRFMPAPP